jgi:PGF-pre-PGF domain-containing protein/PGF-CTERM protein
MALLFSSLMVLSVLGAGVAFAETGVQNPTSNVPDSQVFTVSNDGQIEGWERAAYTLRTDDTTAATQVTPPSIVQGERLGDGNSFTSNNDGQDSHGLVREFSNQRNPIGVHNQNQNVNIEFDANLATSGTYDQLNDEDNVQLVAARLTPQDGKGVPDTTEQALDLFSSVDNANANATFQMVETNTQLSGSGTLSTTQQFSPGNYIIFAAVREDSANGFEVSSGDISVAGDVVLIGMDQLAVQEEEASVTPPSNPNPGDSLTFDIDTTNAFGSSDVTHAVAVYDASTFEGARFDVVVDESALGNDFSGSDDIQLEHSIEGTNGVADVEDGTTVNGQQLSDGRINRPVSVTSIIDFLAEEAGTEDPSTHPITNGGASNSETETIDASVTVVNGENADTTVTVDTFDNFSTGDYRYVVLSTLDTDEQDMSTNTGTITLESESTTTPTPTPTPGDGDGDDDTGDGDGGGGGGGGGAAPSPSAEFDITDATINETVIESGDTVGVNVTIENTGDADGEFDARLTSRVITLDEQSVDIDEGSSETVRLTNTFIESGAYNLKINNDFEIGLVLVDVEPAQVAVNETRQLADEAPDQPGLRVGFRNASVTNITFSNENATGNVSVEDLTRVPHNITQPNGSVVQSTQITVPESERNRSATVQMRVNASRLNEFNASAEELVITRYNDTSEEWEELNTSVAASGNESVLLEAETPGFSLFAVTAPQEEETTPTPTATATPTDLTPTPTPTETDTTDDITTDTPDDTPTETDSETLPGFGAVVALIALLAAALLAMRRQ